MPERAWTWAALPAVLRGALAGAGACSVVLLIATLASAATTGDGAIPVAVRDFLAAYFLSWCVGGALIAVVVERLPSRIGHHVGWALAGAIVMLTIAVMSPESQTVTVEDGLWAIGIGLVTGPIFGIAFRYRWNRG